VEGVIRAYDYLYKRNKNEHFIDEMPKLVVYGKLLPQLAPLVTDGEKLARELNLTKEIKFLDMTPQEDMPALFSQAKMFVYPSHYEGFGMPPLEAMNQGVPTIISKTSSLPEIGGDGTLYCHDYDIHDIGMVMKNLMMNKNLREILSTRARMQAQRFSWEKFVEKFLNIIKNV
jgi:glycosyltransferase involved in cell wall biosynthesis